MSGRGLAATCFAFFNLAAPAAAQQLAVVSRGDDRVAFVDLRTGDLTLGPRVGQFPHETAASTGARAYVPSYGGTTVHALDLSSGTRSRPGIWHPPRRSTEPP